MASATSNIHKVGSGDLTNLFLISEICKTKKPLILSTAMSDLKLINETVDFIKTKFPFYSRPNKLALLHCVAMYGDLNDIHANLLAIKDIKLEFPDLVIGYSDHTLGVVAPILSLALGAEVVEVHFTDDKTRAFRDHHLSLDPNELTLLIESFKRHKNILGTQKKSIVEDVESSERIAEFRRSCYLNRDLNEAWDYLPSGKVSTNCSDKSDHRKPSVKCFCYNFFFFNCFCFNVCFSHVFV